MKQNLNHLESYFYHLPESLIAQAPVEPRDASRLMFINRGSKTISHHRFYDLPTLLNPNDCLIFNDTKVIPARLIGHKATGAKCEILLCHELKIGEWVACVKPGRKLKEGSKVIFGEDFSCEVLHTFADGKRRVKLYYEGDLYPLLEKYGELPLPPYIKKSQEKEKMRESYQTVYAQTPGSIAAPTAGLHFTKHVLEELENLGVKREAITLHVGLGTFLPVTTEDIKSHAMHEEHFFISKKTAAYLNERKNDPGRDICVGTTSCRAIESAADSQGSLLEGAFATKIFIYPGYSFKRTQGLLTNFHLPKSTLLMLVSAFAGYDLAMQAYKEAVENQYRFFSYGDSMLIL